MNREREGQALVVASVAGHIRAFHLPYIAALVDRGWDVDVAANGDLNIPGTRNRFSIPFERSPFKVSNLVAYRRMRKVLRNGNYDVVHVHTPVASVVTRLAAISARRRGTKVIYTAHGFHFYKGASRVAWATYFPVEWALAFLTDHIFTINEEDYKRAKKYFCTDVRKIPGVGIDPARFAVAKSQEVREIKRRELGVSPDTTVGICIAELNRNKNQQVLIRAWSQLVEQGHDVHLLLVGDGVLREQLEGLTTSLGLASNVSFLGRRSDVPELLAAADIALAASHREGLPMNVLEAQISGVPVIASDVRGHRDLIESGETGLLVRSNQMLNWTQAFKRLKDRELRERFSNAARLSASEFTLPVALEANRAVYPGAGDDLR